MGTRAKYLHLLKIRRDSLREDKAVCMTVFDELKEKEKYL
jgi:hypothetical protein